VPHFYVTSEIDMGAALELRQQLNASIPDEAGKISVNDLIIKAAALTLRRVPAVNATYTEDNTIFYDDVDISVAVSIPDGLITPIIRHADHKGLAAISSEMKDLAARAKAGKLKPEEFQGGGFSISNMGMYGVSAFAAIINPPQAAILGVHATKDRPVVENGQVVIRPINYLAMSYDHRIIDGREAVLGLVAMKEALEDPARLLLNL